MASPTDSIEILGTTDEVTACDCCGRTNLKKTVAISVDGDEPAYYGVVCAARIYSIGAAAIRRAAATADRKREDAERKAEQDRRNAEFRAKTAHWFSWLAAKVPAKSEVFQQIEALGGFQIAREMFVAEGGAR